MSRPHGSVLPSLRRASATSLLKTDRFWVNLRREEARAWGNGKATAARTAGGQSRVEFRTLERARAPGCAPSAHGPWQRCPARPRPGRYRHFRHFRAPHAQGCVSRFFHLKIVKSRMTRGGRKYKEKN